MSDPRREAAEKYVCDCLEIMDGSAEAGIKRIGTQQYEQTIDDVLKTLPRPATAPKPDATEKGTKE